MPLVDPFGRTITYLRVSVTDRCNLRCEYCMPPDVEFMERSHLLTYEEIVRFLRVAVPEGIRKVRLTGGEPLARRNLVGLVGQLAAIPGLKELALSTNGVLLAPHARELQQAGLQRINISLDSLQPERFAKITRFDRWHQVMQGIEAALAAGLDPVKVNVVVMKGVNDDEIGDFARWAKREPVHVRFIEYMPIGTFDAWERSRVMTRAEVMSQLTAAVDLVPLESDWATAGPADEFRILGGRGTVGFITAVTNEFCQRCNRIRLTSDGKLRGCLLSNGEVDLREPLRSGIGDEELRGLLLQCLRQKPEKHYINDEQQLERPTYAMHQLGG